MRRQSRRARILVGLVLVVALAAFELWQTQRPNVTSQPLPSAGWYTIYFTAPSPSSTDPNAQRGGLDERLVEMLDGAQRSIDVAIYDFDLENVARALAAAHDRGVRVRMVTDGDTLASDDEAVQRAVTIVREAGIPIVDDERSAIMHHKFVVVDGEWVWTGSWNFTVGDTYRLNNNAVRLRSPELADNFTVEFEKMFVQHAFGPTKPTDLPHPTIETGDARIQTCFESEMECDRLVIDTVRSAQRSIHFLAFAFTHDGIGDAMIERYQDGVEVSGVFETTGSETSYSEFGRMNEAGIPVYQDANRYAMHHKVIVVDGKTVIFGSFNYTDSATSSNDENVLIVTNADFAREFEREFARVLDAAKLGAPGAGASDWGRDAALAARSERRSGRG